MGCFNHKYFTNIQQGVQFTADSHLCRGKGTEETSLWLYVTAADFMLPVNFDVSKRLHLPSIDALLEWERSN